MKKPGVFFLLFFTTIANAQFSKHHLVYIDGGFSIGNYYGDCFNLNYIYNEKYSIQFRASGFIRPSKSLPADFSAGLLVSLPHDQMESYGLLVGIVRNLYDKGTIRLNPKVGLSLSSITAPYNWQRQESVFALRSNYSFDYSTRNAVSLVLNPEIEFPFTQFFGFSASPFIEINTETVAYGLEVKVMLGLLRQRIKPNNPVHTMKLI